eukprot:SAG22_NODE_230_length_14595_cov_50.767660_9_plen_286_part_00
MLPPPTLGAPPTAAPPGAVLLGASAEAFRSRCTAPPSDAPGIAPQAALSSANIAAHSRQAEALSSHHTWCAQLNFVQVARWSRSFRGSTALSSCMVGLLIFAKSIPCVHYWNPIVLRSNPDTGSDFCKCKLHDFFVERPCSSMPETIFCPERLWVSVRTKKNRRSDSSCRTRKKIGTEQAVHGRRRAPPPPRAAAAPLTSSTASFGVIRSSTRQDATSRRRCSHSASDVGGKLHLLSRGQYHRRTAAAAPPAPLLPPAPVPPPPPPPPPLRPRRRWPGRRRFNDN